MRIAAAALLGLLLPATAHADDAARDWSGPYLGAYAGYSNGGLEVRFDGVHPGDARVEGAVGGGFAGWSLQSGGLVFGLEAEVGVSSADGEVKGSVTLVPPDPPGTYHYVDTFRTPWTARLRGRVGWACGDVLLFAAGGLSLTEVRFGYQSIYDQSYSYDEGVQVGWTAGAGLDYAIDGHLTARAEYLYDDYGTQSGDISVPGGAGAYPVKVDLDAHTLRAGLAWQF